MTILSNNLKVIRKNLNCTQTSLAEVLEIGFRTYVRYEAGERDAPIAFRKTPILASFPVTEEVNGWMCISPSWCECIPSGSYSLWNGVKNDSVTQSQTPYAACQWSWSVGDASASRVALAKTTRASPSVCRSQPKQSPAGQGRPKQAKQATDRRPTSTHRG